MEGSLGFLFLTFLIIPLPNFFIFCTGHTHSEVRCIDSERHALLNFKQDLIDPSNRLSSWTVDGDCCHWVGVVCHNLTAHVHQLNLRSFPPSGSFESEEQVEAWERSMFGEVFVEVLEIVSYMTFFSPTISMDMWSLWPLMMEVLADFAIDYFPNKNMEDSDIEPAPKLIQVLFQNCKGKVDPWVEPHISESLLSNCVGQRNHT